MKIKCEYCGGYISEKDEYCAHCGAVNSGFKRSTDGTPKTINELKAWYAEKNLPPQEVTRFFIGVDYKKPRAFGIYEENGQYIVYKNKDDGSRAIRYSGTDEAYAVNELYLKLKSEILNQKAHNLNNKKGSAVNSEKKETLADKFYTAIGVAIAIAFIIGVCSTVFNFIGGAINGIRDLPYAGKYYQYGGYTYYCNSYVNDDWYYYDDSSYDYVPVYPPTEMIDNINDYKYSSNEKWDNSIEKFEDTETGQYVNSLNDSSDSDSDYSWDSSDSWDSDSTDWGADL